MIPRFAHVRPREMDAAFAAYDAADGEGTYYAGGTELLAVMKAGFAAYSTLIDLKHVEGLGTITQTDRGLRIGATVTHRAIERSELVRRDVPGLARLIRHVANVRVRNTGTLGGNLAFAEPHSDPATFLLACDAEVELAGPDGPRRVSIDEFIVGPLVTSRDPAEILVAVHIPLVPRGVGRSYEKIAFFERPAAAVAVRLALQDGVVSDAVVTVGSLTDVPTRVEAVAAALVGVTADEHELAIAARTGASAFDDLEIVGDINGSADLKRHLVRQLLIRSISSALEEARS